MLNNCIVEFDISGEKRGLKFGTLTVRLIMEMRGITSLMDLIVEMSKSDNIPFTIDLLFCSAKAWCLTNKKEIDFTSNDVANWMDEIGMDRAIEIINKATIRSTNKGRKKKPVEDHIVSDWSILDWEAFAVSKLKMTPSEFWELTWYDWSLYLFRADEERKELMLSEELEWARVRSIWTVLMNTNRDPKRKPTPFLPTDLIRLSFDADEPEQKAIEGPDDDLLERLKKRYSSN